MSAKLWGGRFEKNEMDPLVMKFTTSIGIDRVLAEYDCTSTKAYADMLEKAGYMSASETKAVHSSIDEFISGLDNGKINLDGYEDVHSAVQDYVGKKSPDAAKKMHAGRSRNEQVVNDARMYCKDRISAVIAKIKALQKEFVILADMTRDAYIPGYTHLNHAQPVLFPHLVLAYIEMLERDRGRLVDALKRCDVSVMGSGAIAGSSLSIDRRYLADKLGFKTVSSNSIDAVSDRDFIVEFVSALSMMGVHLSRISEDLILYSISEFGFLKMGEEYCTGSSLMPQKKNADVLELIRGRTACSIGALNTLLVMLKGLPHSYNRDLQEDKKPLFESVETAIAALEILAALVGTVDIDRDKACRHLDDEFIYATDLAEYLVKKGVPFKEAHGIIGGIVKHCIDKDINISDLSISELKEFSGKLEEDIYGYLNPEVSVKNKKTGGSTNPDLVCGEISSWKKRLGM